MNTGRIVGVFDFEPVGTMPVAPEPAPDETPDVAPAAPEPERELEPVSA